jgi:hypothetical protein
MTNRLLVPLVGLLIALASCQTPRYMYSPNSINVPHLRAKGDTKLSVAYATGNNGTRRGGTGQPYFYNRGFDVQAAWAPTARIGLLFNQSNRYEKNSGRFEDLIDSAVIKYKRSLTEVGIGYLGRLGVDKSRFQLFVGGGFGEFAFDDVGKDTRNQSYTRFHRADVRKIFLQQSIEADLTRNFTTCFANRFSFVSFSNIRTNYTQPEQDAFLLNNLGGRTSVFWEPALINHFGFEGLPGLRFEIQLGMAALVSEKFIDYRTLNMAIGAHVNLKRLFGKKAVATAVPATSK